MSSHHSFPNPGRGVGASAGPQHFCRGLPPVLHRDIGDGGTVVVQQMASSTVAGIASTPDLVSRR